MFEFLARLRDTFGFVTRALARGRLEELEREIQERERLQEELQRRSEEWVRAIAAHARCILWYADVEDRGPGRLHWDLKVVDEEAAQRFFPVRIPPGLTYVPAWYESRPPEDKAAMDVVAEREVRAGRSYHQEYRCVRADGAMRWLMEEVKLETVAPGRWRAVGVCVDITEQKRLDEERARLYTELQETDRRKDHFLAMLGHELRTPLSSIYTVLELIRRRYGDNADLQQQHERLERQARRMGRLIDDMQDVTRIAQGKLQLVRGRIDLARLVRDVAEEQRRILEGNGLTLDLQLPEGALCLDGDAVRLAQVVVNLVNNAAKYSDAGGRITLQVVEEGSWATLIVSDTGIGIDAGMLPHVFKPFAQAERSLDRSRGGLGLGLGVVRGIVELHEGEIQITSAGVGGGTTVVVRLPMRGEVRSRSDEPVAQRESLHPDRG